MEFIPTPIEKYAKISHYGCLYQFQDNNGEKHIIAIETKYTDILGLNEAHNYEEQKQMLIDTGLFCAEFEGLLIANKIKLTQITEIFYLQSGTEKSKT